MPSNIREFTEQYYARWTQRRWTQEHELPDPINWHELLADQNYVRLKLPESLLLGPPFFEVDVWCIENIGPDHYIHVGNYIWFDSTEQATAFALRWL